MPPAAALVATLAVGSTALQTDGLAAGGGSSLLSFGLCLAVREVLDMSILRGVCYNPGSQVGHAAAPVVIYWLSKE